jgi:hypothetical protein
MKPIKTSLLALAAGAVLAGSGALADEIPTAPTFAPPQRLKVGDKFLGAGRYYPSPVLHDVDGDGAPEIVIGDLIGKVTVASGKAGLSLAAETPMLKQDGKPLKFSNW